MCIILNCKQKAVEGRFQERVPTTGGNEIWILGMRFERCRESAVFVCAAFWEFENLVSPADTNPNTCGPKKSRGTGVLFVGPNIYSALNGENNRWPGLGALRTPFARAAQVPQLCSGRSSPNNITIKKNSL